MVQTLGGGVGIIGALQAVRMVIEKDMAEGAKTEMAAFVHVGASAGQNVGHLHWHVVEVRPERPLKTRAVNYDVPSPLFVHEEHDLQVRALGVRAGECMIVSKKVYPPKFDVHTAFDVASIIDWIVKRGNEKWMSTQGMPPEFTVLVRISSEGAFLYADYCPILSMWGAMEYPLAHFEGGPITLPWPHEVTAAHLRG